MNLIVEKKNVFGVERIYPKSYRFPSLQQVKNINSFDGSKDFVGL
jgi:hypothetical protein